MNLIDQFNTTYTHLYWKPGDWHTLTYLFHNTVTKEALYYDLQIYAIVTMDDIPADFVEIEIDNNVFNSKEIVLEDIRRDGNQRAFIKFTGGHLLYTMYIDKMQDDQEVGGDCGFIIHENQSGYRKWLTDYDMAEQPQLNIVDNWQACIDLL